MENTNISASTRSNSELDSSNYEDNGLESNDFGYVNNYLFGRVFNQQDEKIREVKIELSKLKNEFLNNFSDTNRLIKDIDQKINKIYTKEEIDKLGFISYPQKWIWGLITILASLCLFFIIEKYNEFTEVKNDIEGIQSKLLDIQSKGNYTNPPKQDPVKRPNKK
ncbi:hypothetical protein [Neisseria cinerea]|uniref:hypothetical protein n=1 Tax=Neisseria cinerea TaxID=483 RepID=UPI000D30B4CE|nr:hypothetical protein [Neisseria cinerea]